MSSQKNNKRKMKSVVTGGAGFIGSHIVDLLLAEGMEVLVIDNLSTGQKKNVSSGAKLVKADITNFKEIAPYFRNVDFVFHAAAWPRLQPSFEQPVEHEETNVIGTINCLLACRGKKIKKFVYSSSSSVYGNPKELPTSEEAPINCLNPYALQKYAAEQYCLILGKRYGLPVIALRYSNNYGPRSFNPKNPFNAYSSVIGIFENQRKEGKPLTITGDGEQKRDFVYVKDVARANILAAFSKYKGRVYNISFGKCYSINQVAKMFNAQYKYVPARQEEARVVWLKTDKANEELRWVPRVGVLDYVKSLGRS